MQEALEAGLINSEDIVQVYLERIHKYDIDINSILEINPEVIQIARALDKERAEKGSRGSLHGIPIVLKDNIDTADKMHTSLRFCSFSWINCGKRFICSGQASIGGGYFTWEGEYVGMV